GGGGGGGGGAGGGGAGGGGWGRGGTGARATVTAQMGTRTATAFRTSASERAARGVTRAVVAAAAVTMARDCSRADAPLGATCFASTTISCVEGTTTSTASTGMLRRRPRERTTSVLALWRSGAPTTCSTVPFSRPLTRKPTQFGSQ